MGIGPIWEIDSITPLSSLDLTDGGRKSYMSDGWSTATQVFKLY